MRCSQCARKMQASWNNGRAYYRCKFPAEYAIAEEQHPKTVYVQEHAIVPCLDEWIGSLFADDRLDVTCEALAAVSDLDPLDDDGREFDLRRRLKECDAKLARYRELLEVDSEITSAATWIAEVERERRSIERDLGRKPTSRKHTKNEIKPWCGSSRTSSARSPTLTPRTSEPSTTNSASVLRTTETVGFTSPQGRMYSGMVSEVRYRWVLHDARRCLGGTRRRRDRRSVLPA